MKFKSRIKYFIVTIIFVLCFSTLGSFPTSAKLIKNEQETEAYKMIQDYYNVDEKEAIRIYEETQKAQEFYKFDSSGNIYFDEENALSKGVDESLVEEITVSMASLENEIGDVKSLASSCDGINALTSVRVYFDDCGTDKLVIGLAGVATLVAIVGITAVILGMPVVAAMYEIAALIIAFGATVLGVKNKGCGVYVNWGTTKGLYSQKCD
ncbi:hypothetical protein H9635_10140 [Solibacillus sp. A46]|uniref:Uncharacterized protein n=1 Tax=Solibacillus faecavium TaxID=2762221 RepID=A0ABR8XYV1_9BACL|nr:hypothetical protein [Solibacillus faecavium]MBD8037105.1 hypothetical protein [Solibacillus faecavium]